MGVRREGQRDRVGFFYRLRRIAVAISRNGSGNPADIRFSAVEQSQVSCLGHCAGDPPGSGLPGKPGATSGAFPRSADADSDRPSSDPRGGRRSLCSLPLARHHTTQPTRLPDRPGCGGARSGPAPRRQGLRANSPRRARPDALAGVGFSRRWCVATLPRTQAPGSTS